MAYARAPADNPGNGRRTDADRPPRRYARHRVQLDDAAAGIEDSGYFFLHETVAALTSAADIGLDVVNMSFFVDPWLFNCDSADDYLDGAVTPEQLGEQALTKPLITAALQYGHDHGVTLVASAGNEHVHLAAPTRMDFGSPNPGTAAGRTLTGDCRILPGEGPNVIQVASVGPSKTTADALAAVQ